MPTIPLNTRFIGIAPEVNLYERKTNLLNAQTQPYTMADFISSTGGGAIAVTKAEIDILINDDALIPGGYYLISGVDEPLYGGTTILIQASTTNTLALAGHGIFYNPKYLNSQDNVYDGYGIWSNYIKLSMFNIVGTFNNGDTVTADNGATATYLANDFLQWISGDWSLATSIDNGNGATANVTGGVSPFYNIGDDIIWGGKHWTNISGEVGTADDKYTLSSADWTVVPFNDVDYNLVVDVIHYDQSHDMIIRRKDKWNNDVDGNFLVFVQFANDYGNPIKDFQWGNGPEDFNTDDSEYLGVISNYVKDSYLECINFIGHLLYFNTLTQQSDMYANITDTTSIISNNTLNDYSSIIDNVLVSNSRIANNSLQGSKIRENLFHQFSGINSNVIENSEITRNTLDNFGNIESNTLTNSSISNNTITNDSRININTITNDSGIGHNTLTNDSRININTLTNGSGIGHNTLTNSSGIGDNTLTNSYMSDNTLTDSSYILRNILSGLSYIFNNTLVASSSIVTNRLNNSNFNFSTSGTLTGKVISNIEANYADATFDISTATIIYNNFSKQMFRNSAGVTRLGYYNASDVFTVVNINA